ncbi:MULTISPECIES: hypothetical protein [Mycolicibacterium]|jgi:hypothetical protein|uniref:ORC-CDC6 family AAA ATPase n=1 Tax=Mycolicibacterium TaxID=1866885 RepID=UPI00031DF918|nr:MULTISPECIES: hypothetical protein [Mycolicibacterium]
MTDNPPPLFETFNAKKMSPTEVAQTFVVPSSFHAIAGSDHCYIIGPRGSGKTTLLRMLHGESLMAWTTRDAARTRRMIGYSTIFLPADEMWASQTTPAMARAAFSAQMLNSFVDTMIYRSSKVDSAGNAVHLPVEISHDQQVKIASQCIEAWGLESVSPSFIELQHALDLFLLRLSAGADIGNSPLGQNDALALLSFGIRAFNRVVEQPNHRWALLLDEMELAPPEIHNEVVSFVRGGTTNLVLKLSMSPFDRYMHSYGVGKGPIPGHDFQTFYLSGQTRREIHSFTTGLWRESLRSRGLPYVPLSSALGLTIGGRNLTENGDNGPLRVFLETMASKDSSFKEWLRLRKVNLELLDSMTYNQRSANIRKILPLLVFRDALLKFEKGRNPTRRQRKKSLEPFTGVGAVTSALEGNPRWIKIAFADMLKLYDRDESAVSRGFQFDALIGLANRFEALLRVLPTRNEAPGVSVAELVNTVATYMSAQHTGPFNPDPQNGFTVDGNVPADVLDALVMGLYAGAFVHVRDRRSVEVLSDFRGQRFRLAYILGLRDGKEFPLRLGRDVAISRIVPKTQPDHRRRASDTQQLDLDLG